MTLRTSSYGYFGKLPFAGDFLRMGLSPAFVSAWDTWMQNAMITAEMELGAARWSETYLTAPIWRFATAPGVCGPNSVAGIVMPSLDGVGRRFPFCLAAEDLGQTSSAALLALQPHFEALETLALAMLDNHTVRQDLDAQLAALPAPRVVTGTTHTTQSDGSRWTSEMPDRNWVLHASAMPDGTASTALFDLDAVHWQTTTEQRSET